LIQGADAHSTIERAAFKAVAAGKMRQGSRPPSTHCQKLGHEKTQCFELVGYLVNWQRRHSNRSQNRGNYSLLGQPSNIGQQVRQGGGMQQSSGLVSFAGR